MIPPLIYIPKIVIFASFFSPNSSGNLTFSKTPALVETNGALKNVGKFGEQI